MKTNLLLILLITTVFFQLMGQKTNPNYNPDLAKSLHADELGMKMYVLVILKTGTAQITDKPTRDSLFTGHFANINRLAKQKKLLLAGPLDKNDNSYRGIFILDVDNFDEAKLLLANDPTLSSGIFIAEYYQWYGSAALPVCLDTYDKIWKKKP